MLQNVAHDRNSASKARFLTFSICRVLPCEYPALMRNAPSGLPTLWAQAPQYIASADEPRGLRRISLSDANSLKIDCVPMGQINSKENMEGLSAHLTGTTGGARAVRNCAREGRRQSVAEIETEISS